jgi:hypothetical protein
MKSNFTNDLYERSRKHSSGEFVEFVTDMLAERGASYKDGCYYVGDDVICPKKVEQHKFDMPASRNADLLPPDPMGSDDSEEVDYPDREEVESFEFPEVKIPTLRQIVQALSMARMISKSMEGSKGATTGLGFGLPGDLFSVFTSEGEFDVTALGELLTGFDTDQFVSLAEWGESAFEYFISTDSAGFHPMELGDDILSVVYPIYSLVPLVGMAGSTIAEFIPDIDDLIDTGQSALDRYVRAGDEVVTNLPSVVNSFVTPYWEAVKHMHQNFNAQTDQFQEGTLSVVENVASFINDVYENIRSFQLSVLEFLAVGEIDLGPLDNPSDVLPKTENEDFEIQQGPNIELVGMENPNIAEMEPDSRPLKRNEFLNDI